MTGAWVMYAADGTVKNDGFAGEYVTGQILDGVGIVTVTDGRQTVDQGQRCDRPARCAIYGQVVRIVIGES